MGMGEAEGWGGFVCAACAAGYGSEGGVGGATEFFGSSVEIFVGGCGHSIV